MEHLTYYITMKQGVQLFFRFIQTHKNQTARCSFWNSPFIKVCYLFQRCCHFSSHIWMFFCKLPEKPTLAAHLKKNKIESSWWGKQWLFPRGTLVSAQASLTHWQWMETSPLVITVGGERGDAIDSWWVETRDSTKHPTIHRTTPNPKTKSYIQNKTSIVSRLRNADVPWFPSGEIWLILWNYTNVS